MLQTIARDAAERGDARNVQIGVVVVVEGPEAGVGRGSKGSLWAAPEGPKDAPPPGGLWATDWVKGPSSLGCGPPSWRPRVVVWGVDLDDLACGLRSVRTARPPGTRSWDGGP